MPVCFNVGEELGRNDLKIFLVNDLGVPIDAAEIFYSIYFVDQSTGPPGIEVPIGPAQRTPSNPSVGEYYAALFVPPGASVGDYRIRWTFKQTLADEDRIDQLAVYAEQRGWELDGAPAPWSAPHGSMAQGSAASPE